MAKMVDRIRKALGLKVRIAGAAYTDEWWGDIPPADPHAVMDGVQLAYVGTDAVRTPTHGVPALFAGLEDIEEEDEADWEAKLREAKARAAAPALPKPVVAALPTKPVLEPKKPELVAKKPDLLQKKLDLVPTNPKLPAVGPKPLYTPRKPLYQPKKKEDETLKGIPLARVPETPAWMEDKDDWSKLIQKAKEKTAKAAAQAPKKDEEDWDALIRRAKSAAV